MSRNGSALCLARVPLLLCQGERVSPTLRRIPLATIARVICVCDTKQKQTPSVPHRGRLG